MASPSPLGGCLTNTQPVDMEVCNDLLLLDRMLIECDTIVFHRLVYIPKNT